MRGAGGNVRDGQRTRVKIHRNETGHVRHVGEEVGPNAVGDVPEPLPVQKAAVRGEASHQHFGLVLFG